MLQNMGTRSCTTMAATGKATEDGSVIFGKNSDRPLNEAQPLRFYPAADYPEGAEVECSFIKIPQVAHTYACIGSKPHVFFGFEHGVNEHGVMIGNEQVSGREAPEPKWGLIGMDILRLTLERADSAAKAVEVMGDLLETWGTGGAPGTRIRPFNSNFVIADAGEVYLFESHQRSWAVKKVEHTGYLSNCYSIQDDYTMLGKGVIEEAVSKGWISKEVPFNPAQAWTVDDCLYEESEGFMRYARLDRLMNNREPFTPKMMMNNLRDHYDGEALGQTIYSPAAAKIPCICCHPGGMSGCVTAASCVTVLRKDVPKELKFTYWGSMSPPCCSVFRPFYNVDWLPEDVQRAESLYDANSQWWTFIELERHIALNYDKWAPKVRKAFGEMEDRFLQEAAAIEKAYSGDVQILKDFSARAAAESFNAAKGFIEEIRTKTKSSEIDRLLVSYFKQASQGCGMPYSDELIK